MNLGKDITIKCYRHISICAKEKYALSYKFKFIRILYEIAAKLKAAVWDNTGYD